ncbi:helix-turn-helix transcriptional regulator [Branchiibius cervicis]|uniref:Helix-turn-helix transcriptional regulator n=1 Tax=Branchiibius cervicis TaxID=908252 RepID=A0ABW2AVK8_9MICO
MTSAEVAELLAVSSATLCRWRQKGRGPRWVALTDSSPRYRRADVDAWVGNRTRR